MGERRLRIGTLGSFIVANKFMPREGKPNIGIIELIEPHVVNSGSGFASDNQTGDNLWKNFPIQLNFSDCSPIIASSLWAVSMAAWPCCTRNVWKNVHVTSQSGVYTIHTGKRAIICNKPGVNNVGIAISCRMCTVSKQTWWELPQMEIIKVLPLNALKCFKILRHFPLNVVAFMQPYDPCLLI